MRRFPRRESCSRRNKNRPDGCPACFAFWAGSLRRHTFCQQRQKYAKNAARNRMVSGLPLSAPHVSGCWDACRAVESTMQGALNVVSSLRAPSCQPISDRYAAANRDTSSKPPRFIRHWRRRNRDDPTFRAPCKALPNAWYAPQRPPRRGRAEGFLNHRFKRRSLGTLFRRRKKVPRRRHA